MVRNELQMTTNTPVRGILLFFILKGRDGVDVGKVVIVTFADMVTDSANFPCRILALIFFRLSLLPVRSHESFRRIQVHRYINSFLDRDSHLT
jgi:hypothetical protein